MNSAFEEIFAESWDNMVAVREEAKGPPIITVCNNAPEYINAYTVVLREALRDNNSIVFYTDLRSEKVAEIEQDNRVTIIKYNEEGRVQVILRGTADIYHQNATTQHYWNKDGYKGRRSYLAQPAPSSVINEPEDGLEYLSGREFNETDMEGYENFAVVKVQVLAVEFLKLDREGNRRARFTLNSNNEWQGQWLVP
jgi:pyridoxamine 5'-phosphate oxidase